MASGTLPLLQQRDDLPAEEVDLFYGPPQVLAKMPPDILRKYKKRIDILHKKCRRCVGIGKVVIAGGFLHEYEGSSMAGLERYRHRMQRLHGSGRMVEDTRETGPCPDCGGIGENG